MESAHPKKKTCFGCVRMARPRADNNDDKPPSLPFDSKEMGKILISWKNGSPSFSFSPQFFGNVCVNPYLKKSRESIIR